MNDFFLTTLSKAINQYLNLDADSKKRLRKLEEKNICVELLPFHFTLYCAFTENGVAVTREATHPYEAKITGTPLQLFNVMISKDHRPQFFADDLKIEGNAEFANHVIQLFDEISIDWENELSRFIGDIPAYHTHRVLKNVAEWLQKTKDTLAHDVNEYVHEETLWFPTHEMLDTFFHDIDQLRMDADRFEAKINHLKNLLSPDKASTKP